MIWCKIAEQMNIGLSSGQHLYINTLNPSNLTSLEIWGSTDGFNNPHWYSKWEINFYSISDLHSKNSNKDVLRKVRGFRIIDLNRLTGQLVRFIQKLIWNIQKWTNLISVMRRRNSCDDTLEMSLLRRRVSHSYQPANQLAVARRLL